MPIEAHQIDAAAIDALTELVDPLVERIKPILGNLPAPVQGCVLAQLLALFLAGHFDAKGREETDALRARLLATHVAMVDQLVPIMESEIIATLKAHRGTAH